MPVAVSHRSKKISIPVMATWGLHAGGASLPRDRGGMTGRKVDMNANFVRMQVSKCVPNMQHGTPVSVH
jgi:hypothetical protein